MAHKKRAKRKQKATPPLQCPASIKADPKKTGVCYKVERVQRNKSKGYITAFFSRSSGRPAGFSLVIPGSCKRTLDPFQAALRPKDAAEQVGQRCARESLVSKR